MQATVKGTSRRSTSFAPSFPPPGRLWIQTVQELPLFGGYPHDTVARLVGARPALLAIHDWDQWAHRLGDGAKAFPNALAAFQLATQFFHPPLRCRGALLALELLP